MELQAAPACVLELVPPQVLLQRANLPTDRLSDRLFESDTGVGRGLLLHCPHCSVALYINHVCAQRRVLDFTPPQVLRAKANVPTDCISDRDFERVRLFCASLCIPKDVSKADIHGKTAEVVAAAEGMEAAAAPPLPAETPAASSDVADDHSTEAAGPSAAQLPVPAPPPHAPAGLTWRWQGTRGKLMSMRGKPPWSGFSRRSGPKQGRAQGVQLMQHFISASCSAGTCGDNCGGNPLVDWDSSRRALQLQTEPHREDTDTALAGTKLTEEQEAQAAAPPVEGKETWSDLSTSEPEMPREPRRKWPKLSKVCRECRPLLLESPRGKWRHYCVCQHRRHHDRLPLPRPEHKPDSRRRKKTRLALARRGLVPRARKGGPGPLCSHGVGRTRCKICRGCEHGKHRERCKICNPCVHGDVPRNCALCRPCEHGRLRERCKVCAPCQHGKLRSECLDCSGCEHNKLKSACVLCRPCPHGRLAGNCAACKACPHGRVPAWCKDCNACRHGRVKMDCGDCGCEHGQPRRFCAICSPCPHGLRKAHCKSCYGCPHGKIRSNCKHCSGCPHGRVRRFCAECNPCPHGRRKQSCKECSACPHGQIGYACPQCKGCPHGRVRRFCRICNGCPHGKLARFCVACRDKTRASPRASADSVGSLALSANCGAAAGEVVPAAAGAAEATAATTAHDLGRGRRVGDDGGATPGAVSGGMTALTALVGGRRTAEEDGSAPAGGTAATTACGRSRRLREDSVSALAAPHAGALAGGTTALTALVGGRRTGEESGSAPAVPVRRQVGWADLLMSGRNHLLDAAPSPPHDHLDSLNPDSPTLGPDPESHLDQKGEPEREECQELAESHDRQGAEECDEPVGLLSKVLKFEQHRPWIGLEYAEDVLPGQPVETCQEVVEEVRELLEQHQTILQERLDTILRHQEELLHSRWHSPLALALGSPPCGAGRKDAEADREFPRAARLTCHRESGDTEAHGHRRTHLEARRRSLSQPLDGHRGTVRETWDIDSHHHTTQRETPRHTLKDGLDSEKRRTVASRVTMQQQDVNLSDALMSSETVGMLAKAYRTRSTTRTTVHTSQSRKTESTVPCPEDVSITLWDDSASATGIQETAAPQEHQHGRLASTSTKGSVLQTWRDRFGALQLFDCVSGLMIVVNCLLMGVETEYTTYTGGKSHKVFLFAQLILNVWFPFELLIRVCLDNCRFFTSADFRWNLFDAALVSFSIVDLVQFSQVGLSSDMASTGRLMRIIRLARVVRIMRLFRSLNHIHQFRKMVYCLQASLSTLAWALLLLLTVMYAFAVLFVQGVSEYTTQQPDGLFTEQLLQEYGSIMSAIATLYKAVTGGQSWTVLMDPLAEVDPTFIALFLTYISIVFFGVLNVVTAVFVESAMDSAAHYKDLRIYESRKAKEELVKHMKQVFTQMDVDGSGTISFEEMDHFFRDTQLKMYVESLEVSLEDTAMLFRLLDLDDSGLVDVEEFCDGLLRLQGDARSFDLHMLIYEMAKFQNKWDKFLSYSDNMFNAVISAATCDDLEILNAPTSTPPAVFPQKSPSETSSMHGSPS